MKCSYKVPFQDADCGRGNNYDTDYTVPTSSNCEASSSEDDESRSEATLEASQSCNTHLLNITCDKTLRDTLTDCVRGPNDNVTRHHDRVIPTSFNVQINTEKRSLQGRSEQQ